MNKIGSDFPDSDRSPTLANRGEFAPHLSARDEQYFADFTGIRAVFFDLDDTLCAYWDASKSGLRSAFEKVGPEGFNTEECVLAWAKTFMEFAPSIKQTGWYEGYLLQGEPTRVEQMRRALEHLGIVDEARAKLLSDTYLWERDDALKLFDDALPVLDVLFKKYPLGLITNGPADVQRMEIETLGIGHYFRNVYIEGEMGVGKPNREVFDRAAAEVGCDPSEVLMVGNSYKHDVLGAMQAGWKAIWVRRPSDIPPSTGVEEPIPEEIPEGLPQPDATVGDLMSVLELLAN